MHMNTLYVIHAILVQQAQLQGFILFIHQKCYAFNRNILTFSVAWGKIVILFAILKFVKEGYKQVTEQ